MQFSDQLKIPKDRVAVLIGGKGQIKKEIESSTNIKLNINSVEGDVIIYGDDGLKILMAKNIITAIARGFNPKIAFNLLDEVNSIEVIDIKELLRNKTKNSLVRVRSRLIGKEGKARKLMEKLTKTDISICGKTVSIIGNSENVDIARRAVVNLIRGSKHGNVYSFIEKEKKNLKYSYV